MRCQIEKDTECPSFTNEFQDQRLKFMAIGDWFVTTRPLSNEWLEEQCHPSTVRMV